MMNYEEFKKMMDKKCLGTIDLMILNQCVLYCESVPFKFLKNLRFKYCLKYLIGLKSLIYKYE